MKKLYLYDGDVLRGQFVVSMDFDEATLTTLIPEDGAGTIIEQFKSYSDALAAMYENALKVSLRYNQLRMYGHIKVD